MLKLGNRWFICCQTLIYTFILLWHWTNVFIFKWLVSLSIVHSLVFLTVNLVLLLYTLCIYFCISRSIFDCHLESLGFLFGKLVLNLATVLLSYYFTCFGEVFFCKAGRLLLYLPRIFFIPVGFIIFVVNVVFYIQALYQTLVPIRTFITFTFEYVLFCLSLVD